tara:strand:- start:1830 stop:2483 length:654 start_codon:yes stop_codon:yes gene_type:complete
MKRFSDEKEQPKDTEKESMELAALLGGPPQPELRLTGIYGDVSEDKCSEAVYGLLAYHHTGQKSEPIDPTDPESELITTYEPIDFIVSTHGGHAAEMFAVYDAMRSIRDRTPVHTMGLGKVMSAGVLLLAAGTKGQRKIGSTCRVMIHGVVAGQQGYISDMQNEFSETKYIQKMYIKSLARETNMEEKYVRRLMNRKANVYIDAEEAVKLGIADIIF